MGMHVPSVCAAWISGWLLVHGNELWTPLCSSWVSQRWRWTRYTSPVATTPPSLCVWTRMRKRSSRVSPSKGQDSNSAHALTRTGNTAQTRVHTCSTTSRVLGNRFESLNTLTPVSPSFLAPLSLLSQVYGICVLQTRQLIWLEVGQDVAWADPAPEPQLLLSSLPAHSHL